MREEFFRDPNPDVKLLAEGLKNLPRAMGMMGFDSIRPVQQRTINTILGGVDCLNVLPTSAGKSACYILPALAHDWRLFVFSPLKALMRDQTQSLMNKGIVALAINSDNSRQENDRNLQDWMTGDCKILYVTPEQLETDTLINVIKQVPPDMVAVDEVHCLASWTDNFRHAYIFIGDIVERFNPRVVAGFTATMNDKIEEEVRRVLRLPKAAVIRNYPRRENLMLSSSYMAEEGQFYSKVQECSGSTLIYCCTQKRVEETAADLSRVLREEVGYYHSKVRDSLKKEMQDRFFSGELRCMAATNAFGMGIDKPDIRAVVHLDMPGDPEALSQEVGRAGRDGQTSWCHAFHHPVAERQQRLFIDGGNPTKDLLVAYWDLIRRKADSNGNFTVSSFDICQSLRIHSKTLPPIIEQFLGAKVITKGEEGPRVHAIRIRKEPEGSFPFLKFTGLLEQHAVRDPSQVDTWWFDLDTMASYCGVAPNTLRGWIRGWDAAKYVSHTPPDKTNTKKIIGDISNIDFERLKAKRQAAYKKLDYVLGYFDVDDADKHEYLETYFEKGLSNA